VVDQIDSPGPAGARSNAKRCGAEIAHAVFGVLFESSTEALLVVDARDGRVVSANVRAAELLACELDALVGNRFADIVLDPRDVSSPGLYEDVALRRADAYQVFVTVFAARVQLPPDRELIAYAARDTTERRELERDIAAKHTALIAAYADLERSSREIERLAWRAAAGELVAGMAHHLNNPVGALASTLRRLTAIAQACPPELSQRDDLLRLIDRATSVARRIEAHVDATLASFRDRVAQSHAEENVS
jgi:nitrogen-specific signal transduction histidine kinase